MRIRESPFRAEQKREIRRLLAIPEQPERFVSDKSRLEISAVRSALELPPLPYHRILGAGRWLAGGSISRWLHNGGGEGQQAGDYDFFFLSLDELNALARDLLREGATMSGYVPFCRNAKEYVYRHFINRRIEGITDSGMLDACGRLATISDDDVRRLRLAYIEFLSPENDRLQLVSSCYRSPVDIISRFDFSVAQFIADDRYIYFGPRAWQDLIDGRFRLARSNLPRAGHSFCRMAAYLRRGFRPYLKTVFLVSWLAAANLITAPFRGSSIRSASWSDLFP
ncbi:MAG: hypothetical protein U5R46_17685 [Gammaproteobacteria bacterium]|nr:hypothetical protein [Gammaproteobacteria bacterium]